MTTGGWDDLKLFVYEPKSPNLNIVKSRISQQSWEDRVTKAQKGARALDKIAKRVSAGESLNQATRRVVPTSRRSWVMRNWSKYMELGLEALIDTRIPRDSRLSSMCGPIIEVARLADPKVTVERTLEILKDQKVGVLPSRSTIEVHFRRADERQRYRKKQSAAVEEEEVVELPYAGGELLLAAEMETGGMAALTEELVALGAEAKKASAGKTPERDVELRDERGRFTAKYNKRRRRKRGEAIASYLRPAADKGEERVPSWPRFVHERKETLDAKIRMLTFSWMVSRTKGWNALRAPEASGLEPLTGFAYMPSTLAKLTSALAISGAGPRLLERVGVHWHEVSQNRWGEGGAIAALYVDNHVKEVWSSLFTQSGKVSHLSRVMPCITTTYVHTGAGTPVVVSVQSGSAPLAPRLVELVEQTESMLESDVRRAVVIDSEGSTFDILESFSKSQRVIVTPLRPSRAPGLELHYKAGSYFRPYRDNDEIRIAEAVLMHKSTGRTLELGALLVRREHREQDTVLLTTGLALGMEGRELADLYFARWPIQENAFKDGSAVHLNEHRGNCGRMVSNVAIVTRLERLEAREKAAKAKLRDLRKRESSLERIEEDTRRERTRAEKALATRRKRLDAFVEQGRTEGKQLGRAAVEQQEALTHAEVCTEEHDRAETALTEHRATSAKLELSLAQLADKKVKLDPQRVIRQLDVALDTVLTATKLVAALLIAFVVREYFPSMPMTPQTFISRVLSIRGRRVVRANEELVVFYENPRDPDINDALHSACDRLNARALHRDGKAVRYVCESQDSLG